MPERLTMLDVTKRNNSEESVGLIEDNISSHPELEYGVARPVKGFSFMTLIRSELPTVQFRNANEGTDAVKSKYELKEFPTYILNPRAEIDKVIADRSEDGIGALMTDEQSGILESSMIEMGEKFYYGTGKKSTKSFKGLKDSVDSDMIISAGGTGNNLTSVYLVRFGQKDVQWIFGGGGQFEFSEIIEETLYDEKKNPFPGFSSYLNASPGLQIGSKTAIGCINNIHATETGKTITDKLLTKAILKFPKGKRPDVIFMTSNALAQLQESRTAVNALGQEAPIPTHCQKIPIESTDSLKDTESAW